MKRDRIVCGCLRVSERQVCSVIRDGKACSLPQIGACTGAGTGCTACQPELQTILEQEAAYLPSSPSLSAR
jgi:assimilatory nitrate reductase catalytic subunit